MWQPKVCDAQAAVCSDRGVCDGGDSTSSIEVEPPKFQRVDVPNGSTNFEPLATDKPSSNTARSDFRDPEVPAITFKSKQLSHLAVLVPTDLTL